MTYEPPPAQKHGPISRILDGIHFVSGTVKMPMAMPIRCSRNMTIVMGEGESDGELTLINSMRLDDDGLAELDKLGEVKHVVRIAGFHGMDDPFYKQRYDAKVWAVAGAVYAKGFNANPKSSDYYFEPDVVFEDGDELPIPGARAVVVKQEKLGEGIVHLDRDGGILIAGDSLQNWHRTDEFFNLPARVMMKLAGFIKPAAVGPGWLKMALPHRADLARILDLEFDIVLPVHGAPIMSGAKEAFTPAITKAANG